MPRWVFGVVALMGVLVLGAIAGFDAYDQAHYVDSSYAYVTAPYVWEPASTLGTVSHVFVHTGEHVTSGTLLAEVTTPSGNTQDIYARKGGIVGSIAVAKGASVDPKEDLMAIVQLQNSQIVADIPESRARKVAIGQAVDVTLSAYPGTTFTGRVTHIGSATLSTLSPLLQVGTFSKERQWIPVTITVNPGSDQFLAGENASVRIHI
ncbi:efflux RND transporter periplasmic adaptor subunit [Sulfobacillus thermosulfidooxidans]|uniref:efflux RND transporter periplasmic adaptor subunit n=1 Tax=Sulfobacillus thermosulfidooxidans TaxID=28034 RepID=UPI00036275C2|nr:efflux RND transporter periplasmic adaptor subunit [Sulfobacillus thermosulfidooxidans]